MNLRFQELSKSEVGWLKGYKEKDGIVISSRVRLARNLTGFPFPSKASKDQQKSVYEKIESAVRAIELKNFNIYKLSSLSEIDKAFLVERHIISYDHSRSKSYNGIVFTDDETLSLMINEEDHIRIQTISPGLTLEQNYEYMMKIHSQLEKHLEFAYRTKYGFLTTCPTNLGSGLRVSYLLHLPGIIMMDMLEKITNSLSKLNITVRGFYGEGTKPLGDILQVSNSGAFKNIDSYVDDLIKVVNTLIKYEKEQREKLFTGATKYKTEDLIYRAYASLKFARIISSNEAMDAISKLRLGCGQGMDFKIDFQTLNNLIFMVLPAHLQQIFNKELSPQARDIIRAEIIRSKLS